jgi:hypothetical protein
VEVRAVQVGSCQRVGIDTQQHFSEPILDLDHFMTTNVRPRRLASGPHATRLEVRFLVSRATSPLL